MDKVIKFSQKQFTKNILFIIVVSLITFFIFIFYLWRYKELAYFISSAICFVSILILFNKIKYYPYIIIISNESINVEYLNKSFFKQNPFNGNIEDLSIEKNKNKIILYKQEKIVSEILQNTINKEDENLLFSVLKLKVSKKQVVSHSQYFFKQKNLELPLGAKQTQSRTGGFGYQTLFKGERFNCFAADAAIKVRQDLYMDNPALLPCGACTGLSMFRSSRSLTANNSSLDSVIFVMN